MDYQVISLNNSLRSGISSLIQISFYPFFLLSFTACDSDSIQPNTEQNLTSYIQSLETSNGIKYTEVENTRGAYITSMCYTKTTDKANNTLSNPCYSCHTKGKEPNYFNDTNLQKEYNFPQEMMQNPFKNLFKDRSGIVAKISDESIENYVRTSNYFDADGSITLAKKLPQEWRGYRPDCYFNFDAQGFDHAPSGAYTRWRAFRYYPFLGTFWPTNGSTDDVLIRLDAMFAQDLQGKFDLGIYKTNLAIVESLIKQKDIALEDEVDETQYGVDLDQNGVLGKAKMIKIASYDKMSYVGKAQLELQNGTIHLAPGLFPEGTEFLHTVRYIDWDENSSHIKMAARLKELRYAKKYAWSTYSEIQRAANAELYEAQANGTNKSNILLFRGDFQEGMKNPISWIYQGFIEDKDGALRPQTNEETINCMGCHSHLGATTDSIFAFARKFEGVKQDAHEYGWNHWLQKGLKGIKEPKVSYRNVGQKFEYSFYLQNNHSGNEFRTNDEVKEKFFDTNGSIKQGMLDQLHDDISVLLFPSKQRAMMLNKGYKSIVQEQSYIYGRDANIKPLDNVYKEFLEDKQTGVTVPVVRD